MAAMKAISVPSQTMIDAGKTALKGGEVEPIWQAFVDAIIAEYEASRARGDDTAADSPKEQ